MAICLQTPCSTTRGPVESVSPGAAQGTAGTAHSRISFWEDRWCWVFLLVCLFFHRQPFLRCLLSELAPPLCPDVSSTLHLKRPKWKGRRREGARRLSAGTEPTSTHPGSLARAQRVSHLFSENWLRPASLPNLCFTSQPPEKIQPSRSVSSLARCDRTAQLGGRTRGSGAGRPVQSSGLWWQILIHRHWLLKPSSTRHGALVGLRLQTHTEIWVPKERCVFTRRARHREYSYPWFLHFSSSLLYVNKLQRSLEMYHQNVLDD